MTKAVKWGYITVESVPDTLRDLVIHHESLDEARFYASRFCLKSQKVCIYELVEEVKRGS